MLWKRFKIELLNFLKGRAFKFVLVKLLKSQYMGGLRGWIARLILEELWEEIAEPILKQGLRFIGYTYRKEKGKYLVKKLTQAEQQGNQSEYDATSDDILNS